MNLEQSKVKVTLMSVFPQNIRPKNVTHPRSMRLNVRKPGQSGGSRKNILSPEDRLETIGKNINVGTDAIMVKPYIVLNKFVANALCDNKG